MKVISWDLNLDHLALKPASFCNAMLSSVAGYYLQGTFKPGPESRGHFPRSHVMGWLGQHWLPQVEISE